MRIQAVLMVLVATAWCSDIPALQAQTKSPRSSQFKPLSSSNPESRSDSSNQSALATPALIPVASTRPAIDAEYNADFLDISPCGVKLIEDIEVPALVAGQLIAVNIVPGQAIQENEELAKIDDQMAQRALEESQFRRDVAQFKATDQTAIEVAAKKREFASEQFKMVSTLYRKGSETLQNFTRDRLSLEIAEQELLNAENQRRQAEIETKAEEVKVAAAQDAIQRHVLRSTVNGNVLELIKHRGEWVNAGESVLRIARMDRLRVTGIVDGGRYNPREVAGKRVTVTVTQARGEKVQLQGKIVYVALEQSGNNQYEIWAEIENKLDQGHWVLQASSFVEMRVHLNETGLPN